MSKSVSIATEKEIKEGIEVYFVESGGGCMANDPAYFTDEKPYKGAK